ncbi:thiol-disulfide oxidoreductase DCC [Thalassoporum mexicanum PCC 7367]|uniref:thiol-disulfide oxidoreductase DCC family protein n=1 Tax=Thalassoporum mexicanum TaxID=3457544 RepID=UPI00029F8CBB|nr:DCC1-like thiol-disulfide oxidoreductase family protein [Pseudanabaena sp. PCC 7367]AFY71615.1 thiol-disulfide oxidoreductase DCC [Pseudanabaena sp. PCC 7367]
MTKVSPTNKINKPSTKSEPEAPNQNQPQSRYKVIYDGNCNLCVSLVQMLEKLDRGQKFTYAPMQDLETLASFGISAADCEMGMILINANFPDQRWQGSDAAEEIGRLLPAGAVFVAAYRSLPGMKWLGDRTYEQVRDNRYAIFGKRDRTYQSAYPIGCRQGQNCKV